MSSAAANELASVADGSHCRRCAVCGSVEGPTHTVAEMMFGTKRMFHYLECAQCAAMSLLDPPEDMSAFYPSQQYYSLRAMMAAPPQRGLKQWLKYCRNEAVIFPHRKAWQYLAKRWPWDELLKFREFFEGCHNGSLNLRVLDVGCGGGELLLRLAEFGFRHLTGADPYIAEESQPHKRIRLLPLMMKDLPAASFEFIILNHSLEHMSDQIEALMQVHRLLVPCGVARIEIPITQCLAWETYGVHWAEIDAPRHYCIHSKRSFRMVAEAAGLEVIMVKQAGTPFEFWASELYRQGIPLFDNNQSRLHNPDLTFSQSELSRFKALSEKANALNRGGRGVFVVRRNGDPQCGRPPKGGAV